MDKPFCVNCIHHHQENGSHQCLRNRYKRVSLVTGEVVTVGDKLFCHSERANDYDRLTCREIGDFFKAKE